MKPTRYKIGNACSTGQLIASILGQSDDVVVYTTADHHLRWDYNGNKGKIPAELVPAIGCFDTLMAKVAATPSGEAKKQLYCLLGKCLFWALDSKLSSPLASYFESVEELLKAQSARPPSNVPPTSRKIFVVHGHDNAAKETLARYLEHLDFQPILLHEQPNAGLTVIEKFERHADVAFAVILLTPDDLGHLNEPTPSPRPRARQNVIFELGFFVGRMGRTRVTALYKETVEIPSDVHGVLFTRMDEYHAWKISLAKDLREAGLEVDLNRAI